LHPKKWEWNCSYEGAKWMMQMMMEILPLPNPCFVFGFVKDSRSQQMMMMTTISASSWLVKAMPRKSTPIFASLKSGDGTAVMNEQNG
jgi:hypothetical protein